MKLITSDLINDLVLRAAAGARQRMNHNVHDSLSDPVQRLFIAAHLESYFRPHRHPEKWECALVLRGRFDVMTFDDVGRVLERVSIGSGANLVGLEIPAGTWHTWIPMRDESVFFEIKPGPYNAQTAADFADWSPAEGTSEAERFLGGLRKAMPGDLVVCQAP